MSYPPDWPGGHSAPDNPYPCRCQSGDCECEVDPMVEALNDMSGDVTGHCCDGECQCALIAADEFGDAAEFWAMAALEEV